MRSLDLDDWAAQHPSSGVPASTNSDSSGTIAITRRYPFTGAEPAMDDIFHPNSPSSHIDSADQQPPSPAFASARDEEPRFIGEQSWFGASYFSPGGLSQMPNPGPLPQHLEQPDFSHLIFGLDTYPDICFSMFDGPLTMGHRTTRMH